MPEDIAKKVDGFFSQYAVRKYSKGQILILNGDETNYIFYLTKGKVKMYDVTYRGDEIILNVFKPFAFFPMSMAINHTQTPYIYEAETDIEIRQAPANEAVNFIKENPDVLFDLLARVYKGADGLIGRMTRLMSGTAQGRLIYELLLEGERFGKLDTSNGCALDINEKDIGARAGLTRETVSREIHKLKADGLIELRSKGIYIKDLPRLKQKLGQEI
jgi:CRP-like cAMP-binding protein